tara:strand:+ start:87 stop:647 length:561 start_codon:yes stop_codon:yes gene_type:complete
MLIDELINRIKDEVKKKGLQGLDILDAGPRDVIHARLLILNRDGFQCRNCFKTEFLQIDHIIPRSLYALSHPINLQILCSQCNKSKGSNRHWFVEPLLFKSNIEDSYDDLIDGQIYFQLQSYYDDETINLNNYGILKQPMKIYDCIKDVLRDEKMNMLNNYLKSLKRLPRPTTRWRRIDFAKWETY